MSPVFFEPGTALIQPLLTAQVFVQQWRGGARKERSAAQEHVIDRRDFRDCLMLGIPV